MSATLRLYVAQSTPNSVRATAHLAAALANLDETVEQPSLEVIDVLAQSKRAITDGVIVTPTLIGLNAGRRIVLMGDLANETHLTVSLRELLR